MRCESLTCKLYFTQDNQSRIEETIYIGFICSELEDLLRQKEQYLHKSELQRVEEYSFVLRKYSFLLGRYAAKIALMSCYKNLLLKANDFLIENGLDGEPLLFGNNQNIAISHSRNMGIACLSTNFLRIGIDLEYMENFHEIEGSWFSDKEFYFFSNIHTFSESYIKCCLWSAKESLVKYLKVGFSILFKVLEIENIRIEKDLIEVDFKFFKSIKVVIYEKNGIVLSLCTNKNITWGKKCNILKYLLNFIQ